MKLTRAFYNKSIISFGVVAITSIGLFTTGLAAWVMSTGAEETEEGGVSVGVITDGSLQIENLAFGTKEVNVPGVDGAEDTTQIITVDFFSFDAADGDRNGEIKYDGYNAENLSVTISGTVTPFSYLDDLYIQLSAPAGVTEAATKGYLELDACFQEPIYLFKDGQGQSGDNFKIAVKGEGNQQYLEFSFTANIKWGSEFSNTNPSVYLDEYVDAEGKALSYDVKREILLDFKRMIYGFSSIETDENYKSDLDVANYNEELPFSLTITAIAN